LKELLSSRINLPYLTAKTLFAYLVLVCLATVSASAQFFPNQEVRVANLPSLTAPSAEASAVLATALEIIIQDRDVCCGKDSGLEDAVLSAPSSLKELSAKLQGKHVLGDGLSIVVQAWYFPKPSLDPSVVIKTLMDQQPMLLKWKSHIYVLYGATYDETRTYDGGASQFVIHKLWLLDPHYSDQRRETELNATDDWTKIQGILALTVARK